MPPLFESNRLDECLRAAAVVTVDAALKGAVVLVLAAAMAAVLSRSSAAVKHSVWAVALLGLGVLPLQLAGVRGWQAPILPRMFNKPSATFDAAAPPAGDSFRFTIDPTSVLLGQNALRAPAAAQKPVAAVDGQIAFLHASSWLVIVWAAGATIALARLIVSHVGILRRETWATSPAHGDVVTLANGLAQQYGIRQRFSLLLAGEGTIPATWGIGRPTVSLPVDALDWPRQRLRAVLLHELAHIARGDFLVQTLAHMACALHWFNPLAWYAFRQLRMEGEQASDDLAMGAGLTASSYATQ